VAAQLVASRVVLSSTELVWYYIPESSIITIQPCLIAILYSPASHYDEGIPEIIKELHLYI
jgi:hypothetical protein